MSLWNIEPPVARAALSGATCDGRDDDWCPASGADCSTPGPTVRTETDPIARTAIGLTRLCRLSIKPEGPAPAVLDRTRLRWKYCDPSLFPSDVPWDVQKEWVPDCWCFREARKGAPTNQGRHAYGRLFRTFARFCQVVSL